MRYIKTLFIILALSVQYYQGLPIAAAASGNLVINQVQTGGVGTGTAGQEYIELYNASAQDINVTGWCVTYSASSDATQNTVACLTAPDAQTKLYVKSKTYVTFVSPDYITATGFRGDGIFTYTTGIAATAGHIRLLDTSKSEVDRLAWGSTALHPETSPAAVPAAGKVLQRVGAQDTDNNSVDFVATASSVIHISGLYEVVTIIDVCPNIAGAQSAVPSGMIISDGLCITPPPVDVCSNIVGLQTTLPTGYMSDISGNCLLDVCTNLSGLQATVPATYTLTADGSCIQVDVCPNIVGLQLNIPDGYKVASSGECLLDLVPLKVTELLPNAEGSDSGNEFIELYNPTDKPVDMSRYAVYLGDTSSKLYKFPLSTTIASQSYKTFSDADLKLSLVNTTGRVTLVGADGTFVDRSDAYTSPPEGESWALIDGVWQYTNQPTPQADNMPSLIQEQELTPPKTLVASTCPAGKYRNPLTNRCRNIESDVSVLAACDADQYRNPETGRCRKIATVSSSAVCKDNQYRSEETGRCRKIETAAAAAPCKEGQERNPDTNRCRNVTAKAVPAAAFAVKPAKDSLKAFVGWWALGGIGLIAVGYAGWEWRQELASILRRLTGK